MFLSVTWQCSCSFCGYAWEQTPPRTSPSAGGLHAEERVTVNANVIRMRVLDVVGVGVAQKEFSDGEWKENTGRNQQHCRILIDSRILCGLSVRTFLFVALLLHIRSLTLCEPVIRLRQHTSRLSRPRRTPPPPATVPRQPRGWRPSNVRSWRVEKNRSVSPSPGLKANSLRAWVISSH